MACGCLRNRDVERDVEEEKPAKVKAVKTLPTDQCCMCANKHYSEALCLFLEYGYGTENRALIQGHLGAIVLHTYRDWKEIARLARECALLIQEARDDSAYENMKRLGAMIEEAVFEANPDIRERLEELKRRRDEHTDTGATGQREQVRQ